MSRSPQAALSQLPVILPLVLSSLTFDPNYAEDMDADDDDDDGQDADDEEYAANPETANSSPFRTIALLCIPSILFYCCLAVRH